MEVGWAIQRSLWNIHPKGSQTSSISPNILIFYIFFSGINPEHLLFPNILTLIFCRWVIGNIWNDFWRDLNDFKKDLNDFKKDLNDLWRYLNDFWRDLNDLWRDLNDLWRDLNGFRSDDQALEFCYTLNREKVAWIVPREEVKMIHFIIPNIPTIQFVDHM